VNMVAPLIPNTDITIYNKYIASRAEAFQRTVVSDVVWQSQKGISATRFQTPTNTALILIPFERGTQYAVSTAWQLSKTGKWTLQEGDIVVRGAVTDEIAGAFTVSSLIAKYDDVVTIMTVDAMDQGSPNVQHWEVGCK
jgi:hypothetical protein